MQKIDELTHPQSCLSKAADEEILFVLLARDEDAPDTVRYWAKRREIRMLELTHDPQALAAQLAEARSCADKMEAQRQAGIRKPENQIAPWSDAAPSLVLERIKTIIREEQEHDRCYQTGPSTDQVLRYVLSDKRDLVARILQQTRSFQEDVMTFLRAFALMLETVGNACTHAEKAARLRGLIELVETSAGKVRQFQLQDDPPWGGGVADDVFHSSYPVRHWQDKVREAEARAAMAEQRLAEAEARMRRAEDLVAEERSKGPESAPGTRADAHQQVPF